MTHHDNTRNWLYPPDQWSEAGDTLTATVAPGTDYWQVTHYGFVHDNGPFRYQEQAGNFEARVRVAAKYHELYHQAGLMIRLDEKNWIKAGIEYLNGRQCVSAVVTRDFSDWSVLPCSDNPAFLWIRMQRFHDTVQVSYSRDNQEWSMLRLAYFPPQATVRIGMMAAAPGKQQLQVAFDSFAIVPLLAPPLED